MAQNIRLVDKCSIDSGLVRIGFSEPEQDIVVSCNPADLKKFVATLEVVQHLTPTCVVARNLSCLCDVRSEIKTKLCEECSWHVVCTLPSHVGNILFVILCKLCPACWASGLTSYNVKDVL